VRVMSAAGAMHAAWHDRQHGTGSIVPALAKTARTGHLGFWNGKEKQSRRAGPTASPQDYYGLRVPGRF